MTKDMELQGNSMSLATSVTASSWSYYLEEAVTDVTRDMEFTKIRKPYENLTDVKC